MDEEEGEKGGEHETGEEYIVALVPLQELNFGRSSLSSCTFSRHHCHAPL